MDLVKDVLHSIRGIPPKDVRRSLLEDMLAQAAGETRKEELHQSQVAIVHNREMAELQKRWEAVRKAEIAEQARLDKINEVRLQNLKKARRKLKRMRSKENE